MTTNTAGDTEAVLAAARHSAELYVQDHGTGVSLDVLLLREWWEVDAANGGWSDATWLVYERAAVEHWGHLLDRVTPGEVIARQRCATVPIPRLDDATVEIRLRSGRHRDSEPPPFTR